MQDGNSNDTLSIKIKYFKTFDNGYIQEFVLAFF